MYKSKYQVSELRLEGWLLGFAFEDGYKLKGLRLATSEGERFIKLSKHARLTFDPAIVIDRWVQVCGEEKLKLKTGELKLKADIVKLAIAPSQSQEAKVEPIKELPPSAKSPQPTKAKTTILVCQKSDCCKRGAKQVCQALEKGLCDRGLEGAVTIKGTGCMKDCKAGPNVIINKTRYSRIDATEVLNIINKHFPIPQAIEQPALCQNLT